MKEPYLATVLHQPFCSTGAISSLAKTVEDKVQQLSKQEGAGADADADADKANDGADCIAVPADLIVKRTQAALGLWEELGQNAHTPSTVVVVPPPACASTAALEPAAKRPRTGTEQPAA